MDGADVQARIEARLRYPMLLFISDSRKRIGKKRFPHVGGLVLER